MKHISKLINIGGESLGGLISPECGLPKEIYSILNVKNGFYAFESALLVRCLGKNTIPMDIFGWNKAETWEYIFDSRPSGICFAENVFGEQFFLFEESVWHFDPETSESTMIGRSIDEWAELILDDYDFRTGYSLARDWQKKNGLLRQGIKLIPRKPFVLGGEFQLDNLVAKDEQFAMRSRAAIANQIKGMPDGVQVEIISTE